MEKADEDFQIIRLTKTYLNEARQLLEDCDLTPAGVGKGNGDFLLLVNAGSKKLQAIIGWEIFADSALLRSLAVREQYRQCGRAGDRATANKWKDAAVFIDADSRSVFKKIWFCSY